MTQETPTTDEANYLTTTNSLVTLENQHWTETGNEADITIHSPRDGEYRPIITIDIDYADKDLLKDKCDWEDCHRSYNGNEWVADLQALTYIVAQLTSFDRTIAISTDALDAFLAGDKLDGWETAALPDTDDETHECEECGREFDSEHGVAIHKGHKHTDDETTTDATTDTTQAVADGGNDNSDQFRDEEIVEAIEQHDDPDHPDATTVADARTHLAEIQQSLEDYWMEHLDSIDDDHMSVVYEGSELLVLADHTGHGWNEKLDAAAVHDKRTRAVLETVHHSAAERLCDYSWEVASPFVMSKPDDWQTGELHVERRVGQLATAADASEAAAMDYWSVEIKGRSQSQWARMVGKSQQTVSENIQKVRGGLGAELS